MVQGKGEWDRERGNGAGNKERMVKGSGNSTGKGERCRERGSDEGMRGTVQGRGKEWCREGGGMLQVRGRGKEGDRVQGSENRAGKGKEWCRERGGMVQRR